MPSRNLKNERSSDRPASSSTPSGTKTMDPAPGGGKIRTISGPSIKSNPQGPKGAPYNDKGSAQSS
jgi:hypothetical protein